MTKQQILHCLWSEKLNCATPSVFKTSPENVMQCRTFQTGDTSIGFKFISVHTNLPLEDRQMNKNVDVKSYFEVLKCENAQSQ